MMLILLSLPVIIIIMLLIINIIGNKSINSDHDFDKEKDNTMKFKKLNKLESELRSKGYNDKEIKKT